MVPVLVHKHTMTNTIPDDQHSKGQWVSADYNDGGRVVLIPDDDSDPPKADDSGSPSVGDGDRNDTPVGEGLYI